jgi:two-component system, NarL family, nitrate/nitrite response regulator NarL
VLVLVEDHVLLAQAVAVALEDRGLGCAAPDLRAATSLDDVLAAVEALRPRAVWLDLDLGPLGDGAGLLGPLRRSGVPVLVVTGDTDESRWGEVLLSGAAVVVAKDAPLETLVSVALRVVRGEPVLEPAERQRLIACARRRAAERRQLLAPLEALTAREAEVLAELAEGRPAADIAARAYVAETTVRAQIRAVLRKLGVTSQLQAVAVARRAGWSHPPPGRDRRRR